ncbi:hypothetical protein V5799_005792 [Amblyomma americanum]|uniref:DNA/RNA-binding domain-containing protein n=1 Tax=Amblyomma americanum TaxID=6943 RepID=A0AAQ4DY90_AMBAM
MDECPYFREEAKIQLLNLVDEGTVFYENLLYKFEETHGYSLNQFFDPEMHGLLGTGSSPSLGVSLSDDPADLLPSLKVWTDWMSGQKRLWVPPPSPCEHNTSVKGNIRTTFADLLTVLLKLNLNDVTFYKDPAEDRELVTLPEDATLSSFVPLLGAPQEAFYVQVPCNRERARSYLRIGRIQFFGDYLSSDTESESKKEVTYDSSDEELELGDSLDDQTAPFTSSEEEQEIHKLWTKKEQLRPAKQHERHHACIRAVLQEHQSKQAFILKIRPRYLIPDTNSFIDHLPLVKKLVADGRFYVYVSIVVLNELHGLARGGARPAQDAQTTARM